VFCGPLTAGLGYIKHTVSLSLSKYMLTICILYNIYYSVGVWGGGGRLRLRLHCTVFVAFSFCSQFSGGKETKGQSYRTIWERYENAEWRWCYTKRHLNEGIQELIKGLKGRHSCCRTKWGGTLMSSQSPGRMYILHSVSRFCVVMLANLWRKMT
jgi:hypothetical protein